MITFKNDYTEAYVWIWLSNTTELVVTGTLEQDGNERYETRNVSFFGEKMIKLGAWTDDLNDGIERTIKELDKDIRQIRKNAKLASTLEEKLALQNKLEASTTKIAVNCLKSKMKSMRIVKT